MIRRSFLQTIAAAVVGATTLSLDQLVAGENKPKITYEYVYVHQANKFGQTLTKDDWYGYDKKRRYKFPLFTQHQMSIEEQKKNVGKNLKQMKKEGWFNGPGKIEYLIYYDKFNRYAVTAIFKSD